MRVPMRVLVPRRRRPQVSAAWHPAFLAMLPRIVLCGKGAFAHLAAEARQEAIQEVVANSLLAFARLAELGKGELAYPTVLARYAIMQVRAGRRVGATLRVNDVLSEYGRQKKNRRIERLDRFDEGEGTWQEAVVADTRTAAVPDLVAFRIDFAEWLRRLSRRRRRIAEALAVGNTTGEVATRYHLSAGRVSQLRREFRALWEDFHHGRLAKAV
jgi:hypothetical protein